MTTQKLSGLEHARNWMDSLNMRHYGEVDRAIATERALGHSGNHIAPGSAAPGLHPVQGADFVPYFSAPLNDSLYLNSETADSNLGQWHEAVRAAKELLWRDDQPAGGNFVTSVVEKKAVLENCTFKITAGGGTVDVCNKQANEVFPVWQGARANAAFTLCDGTAVELVMFKVAGKRFQSPTLLVSKDGFLAEIDYIDGYFGAGLSIKTANC